LNTKNGFPVFSTVIEANYVTKKQDLFSAYKLTQEDKEEIEKLSKDPRIGERVSFLLFSFVWTMVSVIS
jgi:DNA replication licensing factor MCM2